MSTGENIRNSIIVLYKTYESINLLMEQCKTISEENGYISSIDKFLRWKSDNNLDGWLINSFILLFQKISDPECISGNGWRDGPVYVLEAFLGSKSEPDALPKLMISKYIYENINEWSAGCSPASHWVFYQPVHKEKMNSFEKITIDDVDIYMPNSERIAKSYWGIKKIASKSYPLTNISSDNLASTIFGTFDMLSD